MAMFIAFDVQPESHCSSVGGTHRIGGAIAAD